LLGVSKLFAPAAKKNQNAENVPWYRSFFC
jgi:hypothetical protein